MDCPRCGERDVAGPECPRCGVILKKARPPRPPRATREPEPPTASRRFPDVLSLLLLGVLAVAVFAVWRSSRTSPPPQAHAAPAVPLLPASPPGAGPRSADALEAPPNFETVPSDAVATPPTSRARPGRATTERLARPLRRGPAAGPEDLRAGEDLDALKGLVEAHLRSGEWAEAEATARTALVLAPGDADTSRRLAYALLRQDRSREAMELLEDLLDLHEDVEARALLTRIRHDLAAESGLMESRLAHFHVRYDGDEHSRIGRAILRVLDRHYATLVRTLDHQPTAPIPVILLSRESYAAATGAPGWSGGLYDSFDGRVRIPIAGLTPDLTPDMDDTLLHELTHAFVTNRSRGVAPREIQEGLAQLVEGKRVEDLLDDRALTALAQGRLRGVGGYYMASLSFVEYLHGRRGQGGLNDLLQAMAETGNADDAFRRVYGRDRRGLQKDWQTRLRQRHGR